MSAQHPHDVIDLVPVDGVYQPRGSTEANFGNAESSSGSSGAASSNRSTPGNAATGRPPLRPNAAFMRSHPAHVIALGFGSGLAPFAPGTAGTLWGWLAFLVLQSWLSPAQMGLLIGASTLLGWWACTLTARHLGVMDPGNIVWDEVVAIWLILWLVTPAGFWGQVVAFGLFRYFDAAKPGPVAWADQRFKGFGWRGGLGIMLDDLVAAFCTLFVIALWRWW